MAGPLWPSGSQAADGLGTALGWCHHPAAHGWRPHLQHQGEEGQRRAENAGLQGDFLPPRAFFFS